VKICEINELVNKNFNVTFINVLKQFWNTRKSFQCIGNPKKQNLLLFLDGYKIIYTDKEGRKLVANSGDIVYSPVGSEYKAQMLNLNGTSSHTIGINFLLYDEAGDEIKMSEGIKIFNSSQNQSLPMLFRNVLRTETHNLIKQRIALMQILASLASGAMAQAIPDNITMALRYLSDNIESAPTVAELAQLCNISEVYFRKQFKTYIGVSPREYRNSLRLTKARTYLEYGEMSVQEISDMLGYSTVSHFIKEFKGRYGSSPLKYRKLNGGE